MGKIYKGFDPDVRDQNAFQQLFDVGDVTYSTTDSQATYRTSLSFISGGVVNLTGTTSFATDGTNVQNDISIPLGAVSSGAITLTRSSSALSAGKYSVLLWGDKFDTQAQ